ncbi:MAG: tRNA lysidine(34) synthetase TilS [Candidatus Abyssubacteria bacterium]
MIKVVEQTIQRHRMLAGGETVLVALSGGPDSVCLLDVLSQLRRKYSITICAAHFNHKLRDAADEDARFAEQLARERDLAFVTNSADVKDFAEAHKLSLEAAGRTLRYEFLRRSAMAVGAQRVAVGHTADDQAETVLMRLLRGTGPDGLAGIPPVRSLADSEGPAVIRPLIDVWRGEVMEHVRSRNLEFRIDTTNELPDFLRNRIRLQLLPHLEHEYNPHIKERLAAVASALALENDFLAKETRLLSTELIAETGPTWVIFHADILAQFHPALRKRIIGQLVSGVMPDGPMLESLHYEHADSMICSGRGKTDLPGGLRLEVSEGFGFISDTNGKPEAVRATYEVRLDGETHIPEFHLLVRTKTMPRVSSPLRLAKMCTPARQYFDLETVRLPVQIRARRPGDTFNPLGTEGTKKLKDFFIDKKVPRFLRDRVPLLLSHGRIMWVMGYAMDRKFMLRPGSSGALRVDYER